MPDRPSSVPDPAVDGAPVVRLEGIGKRFPGVVANRDVSLTVQAGQVHALVAEPGGMLGLLSTQPTGGADPAPLEGRVDIEARDLECAIASYARRWIRTPPEICVRNGAAADILDHEHGDIRVSDHIASPVD